MIKGYSVKSEIGSGGMATVYLAEQDNVERPVAIKELKPGLPNFNEYSERFVREAKIAANLSHPNLVTIHDFGVSEGTLYLVMEYLQGQSLTQVMAERMDEVRVLSVFRKIAEALAVVHSKGLVHRDLKPDNVVFRDKDNIEPVLTDFGIARSIDNSLELTQTECIVGTPIYMSPEQALCQSVQPCSDLYSFGFMLYEALFGKRPYSVALTRGGFEERKRKLKIPADKKNYQQLFDKLLALDPRDRFQNVEQMLALWSDLEEQCQAEEKAQDRHLVYVWGTSFLIVLLIAMVFGLYRYTEQPYVAPSDPLGIGVGGERPAVRRDIAVNLIAPYRPALCYVDNPWMLPARSKEKLSTADHCHVLDISSDFDAKIFVLKKTLRGEIVSAMSTECTNLGGQAADQSLFYPDMTKQLQKSYPFITNDAAEVLVVYSVDTFSDALCLFVSRLLSGVAPDQLEQPEEVYILRKKVVYSGT